MNGWKRPSGSSAPALQGPALLRASTRGPQGRELRGQDADHIRSLRALSKSPKPYQPLPPCIRASYPAGPAKGGCVNPGEGWRAESIARAADGAPAPRDSQSGSARGEVPPPRAEAGIVVADVTRGGRGRPVGSRSCGGAAEAAEGRRAHGQRWQPPGRPRGDGAGLVWRRHGRRPFHRPRPGCAGRSEGPAGEAAPRAGAASVRVGRSGGARRPPAGPYPDWRPPWARGSACLALPRGLPAPAPLLALAPPARSPLLGPWWGGGGAWYPRLAGRKDGRGPPQQGGSRVVFRVSCSELFRSSQSVARGRSGCPACPPRLPCAESRCRVGSVALFGGLMVGKSRICSFSSFK